MKNYKGDVVGIRQEETEKCGVFLRLCVFLHRNAHLAALVLLVAFVFPDTVLASGTVRAESLWSVIATLINTWVTRLGGVVMFVGGIMFGMGWKNDDAEQKSRGVSTLIAGAIVTVVASMTGIFFK